MLVVTWNLFHGRRAPSGRSAHPPGDLQDAFASALAAWEWDVALLQEVPPWWPVPLARASRASMRMALTARHEVPAPRRWAARRWPDLLGSWSGGCNAILVRDQRILVHRRQRLRLLPERRVVHAVALDGGAWVANVHAQVRPHAQAREDLARAGRALARWSAGAPVALLGGDCNVPDPRVTGLVHLGGRGVDHLLGRGAAGGGTEVLDAGGLSDHRPLRVSVRADRSRAGP